MMHQFRQPPPPPPPHTSQSPPPPFALPSHVPIPSRTVNVKTVVGLGTASIGIVYIFNLDLRVDKQAIRDVITRGCALSAEADESIGNSTSFKSLHSQAPFIQFHRVPNESFGLAMFRSAAAAAKACMAITGVTLFGKQLYCQMDKRTQQLLEQWKFLRGKEISAKIAAQGYDVPHNILELVNSELNEQVNKAKGLVIERGAIHEHRITRFANLTEMEVLARLEEDRIQEVLVRKAEDDLQLDKTSAELRALTAQLREEVVKYSRMELDVKDLAKVKMNKRKLESKSKETVSLFEIRQLIPIDRDALFYYNIDWDLLFNPSRGGGKNSTVIKTLLPWIIRKVKDFVGSYDKELVEYIMRKLRLKVDPLELITDLRQYIDDEAEVFVKEIWTILVFEMLRRHHVIQSDASSSVTRFNEMAELILNQGIMPGNVI